MEGGPPGFPQDFSCPAVLRIPLGPFMISHTGLSPSLADLPRSFCYHVWSRVGVLQPRGYLRNLGLGSYRFARHYYGNLV